MSKKITLFYMELAPLGVVKTISKSELDRYVMNATKMIDVACVAENDTMYEHWSQWALWYFDVILYSFYPVDRPQMYDALDTALTDKNITEAHRLVSSCLQI